MGQLQVRAEVQGERLQEARELFFEQGDHPSGLDLLILRLGALPPLRRRRPASSSDFTSTMDRVALKIEQSATASPAHAEPAMEHVFDRPARRAAW